MDPRIHRRPSVSVRLPYRAPLDYRGLLAYLGARAVTGVEEVEGETYRRTLRLPRGPGVAEVRPGAATGQPHLECHMWLTDLRDVRAAVRRLRRLMDLDADPGVVDGHLSGDPLLGALVAAAPGRRSPGATDGDELAVRAVLGQQVSVAAARTLTGRLVAALGEPVPQGGHGTLTHLFPDAATIAGAADDQLPAMPRSRRRALRALAVATASGEVRLDPGADREAVQRGLEALPGVGPWTAGYVRMRALGDPDTFLPTDLAARRALLRLEPHADPARTAQRAAGWAPWRAYALHHLWASLGALPG